MWITMTDLIYLSQVMADTENSSDYATLRQSDNNVQSEEGGKKYAFAYWSCIAELFWSCIAELSSNQYTLDKLLALHCRPPSVVTN